MVNHRLINVHHIPGIENPTDLMTKPLHQTIHLKWLVCISMDKDPGPESAGHQGVLRLDPRLPDQDSMLPFLATFPESLHVP